MITGQNQKGGIEASEKAMALLHNDFKIAVHFISYIE